MIRHGKEKVGASFLQDNIAIPIHLANIEQSAALTTVIGTGSEVKL